MDARAPRESSSDGSPPAPLVASLRAALGLLADVPRLRVALLALLMIAAGLTEGIGIMLFLPLLQAMNGSAADEGIAVRLLHALEATGLPATVPGILLAVVFAIAVRAMLLAAQEYSALKVQQALVDQQRMRAMSAILRAEWRWHSAGRKSDMAHQLITELNRLGGGFQIAVRIAATLATGAIYLAGALILSPRMTGLALACGAVLTVALARFRHRALELGRLQARASRTMQREIDAGLGGAKVAKVFGGEERLLERLNHALADFRHQQQAFSFNGGLTRVLFQVLAALFLAAYVWIGTSLEDVPFEAMLTLVLVFGRLLPLFMNLQQLAQQWLQAVPAIESVQALIRDAEATAEPLAQAPSREWPIEQGIAIESLCCEHEGLGRLALSAITATLPARSTIAIVGASGAGKSTLADVLLGLIEPASGTVLADGVAIAGSARAEWRAHVALAQQDVFLFNDTIGNNLRFARPDASDADLAEALGAAAADFALQSTHGLDTLVGDNGARLSGGERQRLSLARCLLRRPSLLVLDEVTSALDRTHEARVWDTIDRLHGQLLIVVIAHRIPASARIDHFLVLEEGALVAQGSWPEVAAHAASCLTRPEAPGAA